MQDGVGFAVCFYSCITGLGANTSHCTTTTTTTTHRPCEAEVHPDGAGERALRDNIGDLERVGAQYRRHRAAVGARRLRRRVRLVVFQADPEKGFTFALLLERRSDSPLAAVLVALYSLLV